MTRDIPVLAPGELNLITDVPGVLVGQASDEHIKSGTTVITAESPFVASVDVMGGAPGTRETDCLEPHRLVSHVDAIVLCGGSAPGLDAASGVADALRSAGRGYAVGPVRVPIVPSAIIFDLLNGGDSGWTSNPYRDLGVQALHAAAREFQLGTAGAGEGATTANIKGGVGSASLRLPDGRMVGALAVANPNGSAVDQESGRFHAATMEFEREFGGLGTVAHINPAALPRNEKLAAYERLLGGSSAGNGGHELPGGNTTLVVVATDAPLGKAALKRLAVASQDGFARALYPSHTPIDGDIVFALSTSDPTIGHDIPVAEQLLLGHAAALCVARAIARGVYAATPCDRDTLPTWSQRYGEAS